MIADYVRIMRMVRPDVIVTMRPDGEGGGQHHQAQARITGEAFRLAADPAKFPEQFADGLRPWQPRKLYYTERFGFRGEPAPTAGAPLLAVSNDVYDPLLGQTYVEIGGEARSNHKCQGMGQLLPLPGPQSMQYRLGDSALPGGAAAPDRGLFDGVDTTIPGLARFLKGQAPEALRDGLAAIARAGENAQKAFGGPGEAEAGGDGDTAAWPRASAATRNTTAAVVPPLAAGLAAVRSLRGQLAALLPKDDQARFEIDFRLATKEDEFQKALVFAEGIRVDVLADDGLVFGGQPVKTTTIVANRGGAGVGVKRVSLAGFDKDSGCTPGEIKPAGVYRCESNVKVPGDARPSTPYWRPLPDAARYEFDKDVPFGAPFRPTPFRARLDLTIGGADVTIDTPVEYRYEGTIFTGEKRMELLVVPRYSVSLTPDIAIIPSVAVKAAPARPAVSKRGEVGSPGFRSRAAGDGDQRQQGPVEGGGLAAGAGRLDRAARLDGGAVRARRRSGHGPVHGGAGGDGDTR